MNCSKKLLFHYRRLQSRGITSKVKRPLASKFAFDLDENVSKAMESGSLKARHHPGKQTVKCVSLPSELLKAMSHVLADYPGKLLEFDAKKLSRYIWSRQLPLEGIEYDEKLKRVKEMVIRQEKVDPLSPEISPEERQQLLDVRQSKIHHKMKTAVYNWKAINYNDYNSALYLVNRFCPDFAALLKVFTEIRKRDPQFSPVTMFDFGSGVGTGTWAMDSIWPRSCKEVVCIDASEEMNTLADRLLRGGNITDERPIRPGGTFFKQYLPMSDVLKYDLVLSSRSLFELPNMESRLRTLDVLWRKTDGYLVVIEAGTNAGYKAVLEARDYILQLGKGAEEESNSLQGHVFAPCPHEEFCPRYLDGTYIPCNFEVPYKPFNLSKNVDISKETFSYVVLKKGKSEDTKNYPRLVKDPMLRKKHIICNVCTKFGTLKELVATKKKHSKECYNVMKHSKLGDLLPIMLSDLENACSTPSDVDVDSDFSDDDKCEVKV
ncbi:ribosome assembly protein METTL17, mitochondrial [Macrobrachium rosenbergii]|uniref:ribosome assembly protein METTL17, mitochondrial n=1 Tax=Macrobrachium rosenbergii TaxID=79674 RepID=UPI0034D5BB5A